MSGFLCSMVGASFAAAGRTAKTITANANAQVDTAQSKFGGASALFDGTGDRLDIGASSDLAFGTGAFTIECFVRYASVSGNQTIIDFRDGSGNVNILLGNDAGSVFLYVDSAYRIGRSGTQFTTNTWYHVALSRSGTSTRLFIDGTQVHSTYTDTNSYVGTAPDIGELNSSFGLTGYGTNGHIDEFRISKTARYTTTFTPTTSAFVNDADTLLLIHANGTDASTSFIDDTGANDTNRTAHAVARSGNAQVDTAQSQFGGASALFDGTGDYLTVTNHNATEFEFTAGEDFTLEAWVRPAATPSFAGIISLASARSGNEYTLYTESGVLRAAIYGGSNLSTGGTLSTNTWYHVAVSRSGTTVKLFLDGTEIDSDTYTFTAGQQSTIKIGSFGDGSLSWNGHIDEVRISKTARYTAGFTPSASAFVNDANTLLLIHANGTDASTTFTDDNA